MNKKPKIGVIGFSDGEPEVHEELKGIVQEQMDAIVKALRASGEVDVVEADYLVHSPEEAKLQGQKMVAEDVDGTIFSYGVFSFPNFSAIAAKFGKGPFLQERALMCRIPECRKIRVIFSLFRDFPQSRVLFHILR